MPMSFRTQGIGHGSRQYRAGFAADQRDYHMPAEILKFLGANRIRLLSNNPDKVSGLEQEGVVVEERVALEIAPNSATQALPEGQKQKLGHLLNNV